MVRDVRYIWHGISYQRLKEILKENRKLRGFPLVDNPESMILLGSIQRLELIKLIEKHIGRERRLQVIIGITDIETRLRLRLFCSFLRASSRIAYCAGRTKMAQGGRGESARRNGTTDARTGTNEEAIEIRGHSGTRHSQDAAAER